MSQLIHLKKGSVLYEKGQPATHVFVVKKGDLQASNSRNYTFESGETVGIFDCALRDKYSTTVKAVTQAPFTFSELENFLDALAWKLTLATIKKFDEQYPKLVMIVGSVISKRNHSN